MASSLARAACLLWKSKAGLLATLSLAAARSPANIRFTSMAGGWT